MDAQGAAAVARGKKSRLTAKYQEPMNRTEDTRPKPINGSVGWCSKQIRRYWIAILVAAGCVLLGCAFMRGLSIRVGDRIFSIGTLPSSSAYIEDQGFLFRSGWDGPTGSFASGDIYGVNFGAVALYLEMVTYSAGLDHPGAMER